MFTVGQNPSLPPRITDRAKELCVYAARDIASLASLHGQEFGFDRVCLLFAESVTVALFVLLTDLGSEESSRAFFEAAVALKAAARRFPLAKALMRMVQLTAAQTHKLLPRRADTLFRNFAEKSWRSEDTKDFSSEFPNITLMIDPDGVDADVIGLSELLNKWETATELPDEPSSDNVSES